MRPLAVFVSACLFGTTTHADALLRCAWAPESTAVVYASVEEKGAPPTDVRALLQGAPLATGSGEAMRFPSLSATQPERETPALVCARPETEPVVGMLELTFTRRVRLGIEYTLGRCRLFYRCPAAQGDGALRPPERLLSEAWPAPLPAAAPSND
jgi:hypothetical protein